MTGAIPARTAGLFLPDGTTAQSPYELVITPQTAGWGYSSLRVLTLEPGGSHAFSTAGEEMIALPLSGGCEITVDGQTFTLAGRESVFTATTDLAYLPIASTVTVHSPGGVTLALPGTAVDQALPFRYQPASGTSVALRGAGSHTRQVNDFAMATGMQCARMLATEVLTPASNWSSYPPHKHDETTGGETELEEIYYYKFASAAPDDAPEAARVGRSVGYQRVFGTDERPLEVLEEVSEGDTVLVPHGWHGPAIASPSHHMYYLNVMAGPGDERAWGISDHPEHGWVRATWDDQPTDPRLPFYPAASAVPDDSQHSGVEAR